MTFNFDDVKDTNLNVNEFLTLLTVYLEEDEIDFSSTAKDYLSLQEKGYIKIIKLEGLNSYSIRGSGKEIVETIMNFKKVSTKNNTPMSKLFDEFWGLYPSSDKHSIFTLSKVKLGLVMSITCFVSSERGVDTPKFSRIALKRY